MDLEDLQLLMLLKEQLRNSMVVVLWEEGSGISSSSILVMNKIFLK